MFLLSLDRHRYGELIISLKNDYARKQSNCPRTLTNMYGLMLVFNPTRKTPVSRGRNEDPYFGNLVADYEGIA